MMRQLYVFGTNILKYFKCIRMFQANVNGHLLIFSHVLHYSLFQGIEAQTEIKLLYFKGATKIKKCSQLYLLSLSSAIHMTM